MKHRDRFDRWDWKAALNNGSRRSPHDWEPAPGDTIAGRVVDAGELPSRYEGHQPTPYLDLRVVGGTLEGQPLEEDAWYRVKCSRAQLRKMLQHDRPAVGDLVAVEYTGMRSFRSGLNRAAYRTVVEKSEPERLESVAVEESPTW